MNSHFPCHASVFNIQGIGREDKGFLKCFRMHQLLHSDTEAAAASCIQGDKSAILNLLFMPICSEEPFCKNGLQNILLSEVSLSNKNEEDCEKK